MIPVLAADRDAVEIKPEYSVTPVGDNYGPSGTRDE
jgi:hypothetical protein